MFSSPPYCPPNALISILSFLQLINIVFCFILPLSETSWRHGAKKIKLQVTIGRTTYIFEDRKKEEKKLFPTSILLDKPSRHRRRAFSFYG
jgi:hypothetical protein